VLLGIEGGDDHDDIKYITHKIIKLRIFNDSQGRMNFSVDDVDGSIMVVSQFTLCGDVKRGNRPSYINAMDADLARGVYDSFIDYIRGCHPRVESGTFQADMNINLINSGPVTLIIRSRD
jgi:D-tyrosyl-tRNA(Tyr) deacylase